MPNKEPEKYQWMRLISFSIRGTCAIITFPFILGLSLYMSFANMWDSTQSYDSKKPWGWWQKILSPNQDTLLLNCHRCGWEGSESQLDKNEDEGDACPKCPEFRDIHASLSIKHE
jgi:hypothetical protein